MSLVPALLGLLVSLLVFVVGLVGAALFVVSLPASYFVGDAPPRPLWGDRHPVLRWTGRILKNALGMLTVAVGIVLAMPGVPGPGLLTIVIGLTLLDFPGKRRLERRLIGLPAVRSAVDRIRRRYKRAPLVLDTEEPPGNSQGGGDSDE